MAEKVARRLTVIVSADVVAYARLIRADESGTRAALRGHRDALIDPKLAEHRGRLVSTAGDSLLAEFASVVDAAEWAIDVQRAMQERTADEPEDRRIVFRIGINSGDVIIEGDDIHGDGVNVAARLQSMAEPGGICISANVFEQVRHRLEIGFEDLGDQEVKNIHEPVRAYQIRLDPEAAGKVVGQMPATKPKPKRRWVIPAAAVVVVIAIAAGVLLSLEPWVPRVEAADPAKMAFPLPEKPSLVVLPFENVGGDPEQDIFVDGATGDIISHLSTWPDLFVIDRHSSYAYQGRPVTVKQVAEELGVRYVLQSTVQRSGTSLRISAQLIDALSGRHIWSDRYDRAASDLFALQDEITKQVSIAMGASILGEGEGVRARSGDNLVAWEIEKKARDKLLNFDQEDNVEARKLFKKAIEVAGEQPTFLTGLAWTHWLEAVGYWSEDREASLTRAEEFANNALSLDEADPGVFWVLGEIASLRGQHDKAIDYLRHAVALAPSWGEVHAGLAIILSRIGKPEEGLKAMKIAMRLSPFHPSYWLQTPGFAYDQLSRFEDALAIWRQYHEMEPKAGWGLLYIAIDLWALGQTDESRETIGEFLTLQPSFTITQYRSFGSGPGFERGAKILAELGVPEHPPLPLPDKPSIAVLPFTNMSDDPEQEWFADGMTDDLITDLSKISGLFVIARNSSFTYKGQAVDVKTVGRELGVKHVLEGSVRRMGDQVRINAQLIDAATGGHLWAERYDGAYSNFFALQDEVLAEIVASLTVNLTPAEESVVTREPTDNFEAYEHFRRGEHAILTAVFNPDGYKKALGEFERAIALDPEFAEAHAGDAWVAYLVWFTGNFQTLPARQARERAEASAERALELHPENARALHVISNIKAYDGDFEAGIELMGLAVASNPNSAEAHAHMAAALSRAGRHAEAVEAINTAFRLDPTPAPTFLARAALVRFLAGDYPRAAELSEWVLEAQPSDFIAMILLAAEYAKLGRLEDAQEMVERIMKQWPGANVQVMDQNILKHYLKRPEDLENYLGALRLAGFPEWPFGAEGRPEDRLSEDELHAQYSGGSVERGIVDFGMGPVEFEIRTATDGRYKTTVKFGAHFSDFDVGIAEIRDGMHCYRSDVFSLSKAMCGYVYRNPEGSNDGNDAYIRISPGGILRYSISLGAALTDAARADTLAESTGEHLSGAQIEQMLLNGTIQGKNRGNPYTVTYGEGGLMSGVAGKNDEFSDTGKWWVEGDRLCRQFKIWQDGAAACFDIVLEDGNFKWYDTDGLFLDKRRYVPN